MGSTGIDRASSLIQQSHNEPIVCNNVVQAITGKNNTMKAETPGDFTFDMIMGLSEYNSLELV
jgi:hypothetical protein